MEDTLLVAEGGGAGMQWLETFEVMYPEVIDFDTLHDHWLYFRHHNPVARRRFPDITHLPSVSVIRSPWQDAFDAVFRHLLDWKVCCLDIFSLHVDPVDTGGFFRILRQGDRFVIGRCIVGDDNDEFIPTMEAIRNRKGCDSERRALVFGFFALVTENDDEKMAISLDGS